MQNNSQSDSSGMSPFFANKGFHPQLSITPTIEACDQDAMEISGEMTQILEQLQAELRLSQEAQAHTTNLHRVPSLCYQAGDLVWLNTKNIRICHPCKKLDDKWIGLFKVSKTVGSHACHLELSHTLKIHPVFHVSLLNMTPTNPILGQSNEHPGPVISQDTDEEFQVEEILNSKPATSRQKFKYLVKWTGWPIEDATKEPIEHLDNTKDTIYNFHEKYPRKPQPQNYVHEQPEAHRSLPCEGGG